MKKAIQSIASVVGVVALAIACSFSSITTDDGHLNQNTNAVDVAICVSQTNSIDKVQSCTNVFDKTSSETNVEERGQFTPNVDWFKSSSTYIWDDWKLR